MIDLVALIHQSFRLEGEAVVRKRTGREVRPLPKGYTLVSIRHAGRTVPVRLHVIKFALLHGYIPPIVDHANRNKADNSASNLRAATPSRNLMNVEYSGGVRRRKSGRWQAYITMGGRQVSLGTYEDRAEAERIHDTKRQELHGNFSGQRKT